MPKFSFCTNCKTLMSKKKQLYSCIWCNAHFHILKQTVNFENANETTIAGFWRVFVS